MIEDATLARIDTSLATIGVANEVVSSYELLSANE
jgi:hypothetical protein